MLVFALAAVGQDTATVPQGQWSVKHQFKETTPLAQYANKWLLSWSRSWHGENFEAGYRVTYFDPANLISVLADWMEHSPGAAHPNSSYEGLVFAEIDGSPRQVWLKNFFRDNSDYRERVTKAVIEKLKNEEGASDVRSGEVKTLTNEQLDRFVVEPDGLVFLIDQYEVGPYSAGRFKIKLTFEELGPDFRMEMIRR